MLLRSAEEFGSRKIESSSARKAGWLRRNNDSLNISERSCPVLSYRRGQQTLFAGSIIVLIGLLAKFYETLMQ
jgi:hypothetical protein